MKQQARENACWEHHCDNNVNFDWRTRETPEYAEIVFGKDFAEEEEVKDILDDYTKGSFTIVEFERDEKARERPG